MDSRELRSLQEAYLEVHQVDESSIANRARNAVADQRLSAAQSSAETSLNRLRNVPTVTRGTAALAARGVEKDVKTSSNYGPQLPKPGTVTGQKIEKPKPTGSKPKGSRLGGSSSLSGVGGSGATGGYQVGASRGYGISGIRLADHYDVYDIILSHLLDEGYAETIESAEAIMVNMSEEWKKNIEAYLEVYQVDEAEKWIQKAIKKPGALSKQLGVPEDENIPAGKLAAAAKKGGKLGKRARLAMTLKGLRREEIDLYDTVFTHLLDEGYANTEEAAHKIIMNMSEGWTESILEMNDFAAGGGAAKMKATGMTKDQVVALGKKNLASKPASSSPSSSGKSTGSTPSDAVRDRLASREKYRDTVNQALAAGVKGPVGLLKKQAAQDQEAKFDAYQKKQRESGYYKTGYKNLPGTFEKG